MSATSSMSVDEAFQPHLSKFEHSVNVYRTNRNLAQFSATRQEVMQAMLSGMGQSLDDVQQWMTFDMLPTTNNGFRPAEPTALKFPDHLSTYASIDGLRVNAATGEVKVLATPPSASAPALVSDADIEFVLRNGISEMAFSLDNAVRGTRVQPLQEASVRPQIVQREGGDIFKTLISADMLLKTLSTGQEVSRMGPTFEQRSTEDRRGMMRSLDAQTSFQVRSVQSRTVEEHLMYGEQANLAHVARKWFDSNTIEHTMTVDGDETLFVLGHSELIIKGQVFRKRTKEDGPPPAFDTTGDYLLRHGLVEMPSTGRTPDEQFVNALNPHMSSLCQTFPDLARLRQLYRIVAVCKLLMAHGDHLAANNQNDTIERLHRQSTFALLPAHRPAAPTGPTSSTKRHCFIPTSVCLGEDNDIKEDMQPAAENNDVPHPLGAVVDAQDEYAMWFTGKILMVQDHRRYVHFDSWDSAYDTWLPLDLNRIVDKNTHTPPGRSSGPGSGVFRPNLEEGAIVEVLHGRASNGTLVYKPAKHVSSTDETWTVCSEDGGAGAPVVTAHFAQQAGLIRLAPINNSATIQEISSGLLRPGHDLDACDEYGICYTASVVDVDLPTNTVKVKYDGWEDKWMAWHPMSTDTLAPMFTYVPQGTRTTRCVVNGVTVRIGTMPHPHAFPEGTRVDVRYPPTQGTFHEAIVLEQLNAGLERSVRVRFCDEDAAPENREVVLKIADGLVRQKTPNLFNPATPEAIVTGDLRVGHDVDVCDDYFCWSTATITKVSKESVTLSDGTEELQPESEDQKASTVVTVTYHGWPALWDERIELPSSRIQPLHTHTRAGFRSADNRIGRFVVPPVHSSVLIRQSSLMPGETSSSQANFYQRAKIVAANDAEHVCLQIEGQNDTVRLSIASLTLGQLKDDTIVQRAPTLAANYTFGGIKMNPLLKRVANISLGESACHVAHYIDQHIPAISPFQAPPKNAPAHPVDHGASEPRVFAVTRNFEICDRALRVGPGALKHSGLLFRNEHNSYGLVEFGPAGVQVRKNIDPGLVTQDGFTDPDNQTISWKKHPKGVATAPGVTVDTAASVMRTKGNPNYDLLRLEWCHRKKFVALHNLGIVKSPDTSNLLESILFIGRGLFSPLSME